MANSTLKENGELVLKFSLPTFIFLGLAKTTAYYNQFHLPILEYLTFSEMITIFLNNIYVYAALSFLAAIFFLLDERHFRGSLTLIVIGFIFVSVFSALSGNFRFDTSNNKIVISGIILFVVILITISKQSVNAYLATLGRTTKNLFAAVFTILVLLVISSFQGKFEADQVKRDHIYSQTSIKIKSGTIVSNDSIFYIGKTNEYVFFYIRNEKSVQIYPMTEVEEITYKTKEK